MPKVMQEFEHLETVRIHFLRNHLKKYTQVLSDPQQAIKDQHDLLLDTVSKITPDFDIDMMVKVYRSGNEIPEPFEFEPFKVRAST
jgi:hypothetical protein